MSRQLPLFTTPASRDPTQTNPPTPKESPVICGKVTVDWDHAVVYVHDQQNRYGPPTFLHFSFVGTGPCLTTEVVRLVDQWTRYRGVCRRPFRPDEHEFRRAQQLAILVVETYRRNYLLKHGQAPNPLLLTGALDPHLVDQRTALLRRQIPGTVGTAPTPGTDDP